MKTEKTQNIGKTSKMVEVQPLPTSLYTFPAYGVQIEAVSHEEAETKLQEFLSYKE